MPRYPLEKNTLKSKMENLYDISIKASADKMYKDFN